MHYFPDAVRDKKYFFGKTCTNSVTVYHGWIATN